MSCISSSTRQTSGSSSRRLQVKPSPSSVKQFSPQPWPQSALRASPSMCGPLPSTTVLLASMNHPGDAWVKSTHCQTPPTGRVERKSMDQNEQERLRQEVDEVLHGQRQPQEPTGFAQNDYSNIHHVIGVMSGKGGVGKVARVRHPRRGAGAARGARGHPRRGHHRPLDPAHDGPRPGRAPAAWTSSSSPCSRRAASRS